MHLHDGETPVVVRVNAADLDSHRALCRAIMAKTGMAWRDATLDAHPRWWRFFLQRWLVPPEAPVQAGHES